jgi:hypothetical protein
MKIKSIFASSLLVILSTSVMAIPVYTESFEGQDNDWISFPSTPTNTPSGSLVPTDGAQYGVLGDTSFTRFDGYRDDFGNGWSTSLDIYLDTNWAVGTGFDWDVASSNQDGNFLRDFIFHVGQTDDGLLVSGSNNTDFKFNEYLLNGPNVESYTVRDSGWFTFEHVYYDLFGSLAVDMNLIDALGNTVFSTTRNNPSDLIDTIVGGNRYGWMNYNTVGELAIDNQRLSLTARDVPEPAAVVFILLSAGLVFRRRMK